MNQQCPKCQASLKPNAQFCGKCGTKLESPVQDASAERTEVVEQRPNSVAKTPLSTIQFNTSNPSRLSAHKRRFGAVGIVFGLVIVGWIVINVVKDTNSSPLTGTYVNNTSGQLTSYTFDSDGSIRQGGALSEALPTQYYRRYGQTIKTYSRPYNWFSDLTESGHNFGPSLKVSSDGTILYEVYGISSVTYTKQNE